MTENKPKTQSLFLKHPPGFSDSAGESQAWVVERYDEPDYTDEKCYVINRFDSDWADRALRDKRKKTTVVFDSLESATKYVGSMILIARADKATQEPYPKPDPQFIDVMSHTCGKCGNTYTIWGHG